MTFQKGSNYVHILMGALVSCLTAHVPAVSHEDVDMRAHDRLVRNEVSPLAQVLRSASSGQHDP